MERDILTSILHVACHQTRFNNQVRLTQNLITLPVERTTIYWHKDRSSMAYMSVTPAPCQRDKSGETYEVRVLDHLTGPYLRC